MMYVINKTRFIFGTKQVNWTTQHVNRVTVITTTPYTHTADETGRWLRKCFSGISPDSVKTNHWFHTKIKRFLECCLHVKCFSGCSTYAAIAMSRGGKNGNPTPASFPAFFISTAPLSLPLAGSEVDNHPWRWWKTLIAVTIFSYCGEKRKKNPVRHRCQFSVIFWNAILLCGRRGGRLTGSGKCCWRSPTAKLEIQIHRSRTRASTSACSGFSPEL